ncbi:FliI/YscN family ATPase [Bradyrhizobium oligotrophicum]|uniref:FliI/YscN family ATPase n=1 Tax=Bradyrhizobium oligotrophicum TaxID=44255 RepID=UPI003EB74A10
MTRQSGSVADFSRILPNLRLAAKAVETRQLTGRVVRISGTLIHAICPGVRIGEMCALATNDGRELAAEVVGLDGMVALLTPIGDLDGLSTQTVVVPKGHGLQVPVGPGLLGRVIDSFGRPLDVDERGPLPSGPVAPARGTAPPALARGLIERPLALGIRSLDGLLTCGEGQRLGIFGEPGTGKSSLVAQIVHNAAVDITVIALIGERGREVREFIERHLTEAARARAVVVVATSDRPAIERVKAAHVATAIAERFRDDGARVLLLQDSITRFARALREIGLAAGEPPTRRGFPPSVFAELPVLLERSGPGVRGSITAFYTVLVEGDGTADPIAEETRSILDGHIVLSPTLAQAGRYPAIDVSASLSRVMERVVTAEHLRAARHVRQLLARYAEIEFLLQVGEYKPGSDAIADEAVAKREAIGAFLAQAAGETSAWTDTLAQLKRLAS